ncbi:glycerol-3-phosphate dehydrogenase/oxidase [Arthrobacter sp.]|uniref:glycerol-3-phosphate dehydrogenase/oxidase n=1 Tax=Arthrobacter sp. TaxID=1667 RepID=UPI00289B96D3|nr:glycerol-3-phosphate dehydrogenase/oxidase [Arthrobacter sp.]
MGVQTKDAAGDGTRASVRALKSEPAAQVLVIGGGINGIATFRDLAMQGVSVALVEGADYVSGASSASSHMVHGGIRYLENGEFRLVREAVVERNNLLRIAPHYVKPLRTTIPVFSTFAGITAAPLRFLTHRQGRPQERGALLIKLGLAVYDSFSRSGGAVPRHEFRGRRKSLAALPQLNPRLRYTATYYDASMHDPERLALDVLADGLAEGRHARAANYVSAVGMGPDGVLLRDACTGEEFTFRADVVVNATGPWTDLTNAALGQSTHYMGGTKGSHIVLNHPELLAATGGSELFFEHKDGRIVLIYPFKDRVLVGTTDLEADPRDAARCTEEEVEYFFDLIHHVFPDIEVDRSQIVYRFAGIRPLPGHGDLQPGFVSRDYRIESTAQVGGSVLLSLVGGKWTTFRALAEHLANDVLKHLGQPRRRGTSGEPIGGGRGGPAGPAERSRWIAAHRGVLVPERCAGLLDRYGTRALGLLDLVAGTGEHQLKHHASYTREEIGYLVRTEEVVRLTDLVQRRTSLAFRGELTRDLLLELAAIAGGVLGWSPEQESAEVDRTEQVLSRDHGMQFHSSGSLV